MWGMKRLHVFANMDYSHDYIASYIASDHKIFHAVLCANDVEQSCSYSDPSKVWIFFTPWVLIMTIS